MASVVRTQDPAFDEPAGGDRPVASSGRRSLLARIVPRDVRELSRGVVALLVAIGLFNASNYVFHVAISRLLGPGEYGALAALLAALMVLSVPLSVIQAVVAKRAAILDAAQREAELARLTSSLSKAVLIAGTVAAVVLVAASPLIAWMLRVDVVSAALLAPFLVLSVALSVGLGVLQGRQRFGSLAGIQVATVFIRLGVGVGLVSAGWGVPGAVLATVLSQAGALWVTSILTRRRSERINAPPSFAALRGEFGTSFLTLASFWLLAEVDILLARHYLEPHAAGLYSAAGLLGRALLFLPAAVSVVALPKFAAAARASESLRKLRSGLIVVGAIAGVAYVGLVALRRPLIWLAFGDAFTPASGLLALLAAGGGVLASVNLLAYFHIAETTKAYRLILIGIAVEIAAVAAWHETAAQIGSVALAVNLGIALLLYVSASAASRWRPAAASDPALPVDPLRGDATVDLTVVVPCHNAGATVGGVLERLRHQLRQVDSWEIIVVSDGSTDETVAVTERLADARVRAVVNPARTGKGHALRTGLAQARGRFVAFMDGDGDLDPRDIRPFIALMELYDPDVVLGSKRHPLSDVSYPPLRRALSWSYHKLCRILFRVNVRDTQTGFKMFRRDVMAAVLPRLLEKRYAFDLEFLVAARRLGFTRVFEAPIRLDYRFESHVDARSTARILLDTLSIFFRRYILDTYGRNADRRRRSVRRLERDRDGTDDPQAAAHGEPLRVLFLNWRDIRNPDAGGAEMVTHEVARRWVRDGHRVELLTSRFPGCRRVETIDGVRVRRMGRLRAGTFHLRVRRELRSLRGFDVVIDEINTMPFMTPLLRDRLPATVALIHQLAADVWDAEVPRPVAVLGRAIEPHLLRTYRHTPVVTVSDSTRQDLLGLGLRDVTVIPNGRDDPPDVTQVRKEQVPTFLFVGRLTANKRPDHAIRAFEVIRKRLPEARLWVVGGGPMERKIAATLPPGAELLGHLPRDELYRRMARAHALLVPSVREGWGLVVIEANSVGTMAVGYDVPGIRDSIEDGRTGILVREGDPVAMGDAAAALVRGESSEAMGSRARERALGYGWDRTASELMNVVRAAVAAHGMAPAAVDPSVLASVPDDDVLSPAPAAP